MADCVRAGERSITTEMRNMAAVNGYIKEKGKTWAVMRLNQSPPGVGCQSQLSLSWTRQLWEHTRHDNGLTMGAAAKSNQLMAFWTHASGVAKAHSLVRARTHRLRIHVPIARSPDVPSPPRTRHEFTKTWNQKRNHTYVNSLINQAQRHAQAQRHTVGNSVCSLNHGSTKRKWMDIRGHLLRRVWERTLVITSHRWADR